MLSSVGNFTNIDVCSCVEFNYTGGKCLPGTYCPSGSSAPVSCDPGFYCKDFELASPTGQWGNRREADGKIGM